MEKNEKANLIFLSDLRNDSDLLQNKKTEIISNNKQRYYIFDNFKGILIFKVVFAHFLIEYSNSNKNSLCRTIVVFIYFYHMEAFIFISGFLTSENSMKIINAVKLLILYYIFNFSFSIIIYFYINVPINFLFPQYSYWYLLSLFYWRISIKYLNNIQFIFSWSIIISLLEGYWNCFTHLLSIYKTIVFFPFFLSGYKIKKLNIINKLLIWKAGLIKFIIFCIIFCSFTSIVYLYINNNNISDLTIFMGPYNETNTITKRIIIIFIAFVMIILFILILPNKKIPLINKWGRNSLYIFLFHRIITIIVYKNFIHRKWYTNHIIEFSALFTLIILFVFGLDSFNNLCNSAINSIHKNIIDYQKKGKIICNTFCLSFILILLIKPFSLYINNLNFKNNLPIHKKNYVKKGRNYIAENLNKENSFKDLLDNSIRISYIGDLILLKSQITAAKNNITGKYEFDDIFKYTSKHFHESDFTIGVYEGTSAGNETSYSNSNYETIPLYLNFPDEFAESVKKAGIDLVTTANNHLFDKKLKGALRTIDVLERYNITNIGSYRNNKERKNLKIIDIKGIKIAFLAYTSIMNRLNIEKLYEDYKYLTNIIPKVNNKYFNEIYKEIESNFIEAKKYHPDIIMVLPHMGIEFQHQTNEFQHTWNQIFTDLGADIILGDHSHAVQPLQYNGKAYIVNCPGNFANSFIKMDGDSTAIIDIYINKNSKKIIGLSAIPMYTKQIRQNYFSAIPIHDLINNKSIILTDYEKERIKVIQAMSTKVLVGRKFEINETKKKYYFVNNSYFDFDDEYDNFCDRIKKYSENKLYKYIEKSNSITFISDTITEGSKHNYSHWYKPIIKCFKNKKIINISKVSYTTKLIVKHFKNDIINSNSELYIISIGLNDIRYRNKLTCAMDSKEYIQQIKRIVEFINNKKAKFIFIAPWYLIPDTFLSKLKYSDKNKLMNEYSLALKGFANTNNYVYIDANDYIEKFLKKNKRKYMVNPNTINDNYLIELYCEGLLMTNHT